MRETKPLTAWACVSPEKPMTGAELVNLSAAYAIAMHGDQRYGSHPYATHLATTAAILAAWGADAKTLAAGWLHDVLEDTDLAALPERLPEKTRRIVNAVTGEGATRAERVQSIYAKITACPEAAIVKLADRTANLVACQTTDGIRHAERYLREAGGFEAAIRPHVSAAAWAEYEDALQACQRVTITPLEE